jgi:glycerate 2-kinase
MGKIRNFDALATTDLRRAALSIAEAGYAAIDTPTVIQKNVSLVGDTLHVDGKDVSLSGVKRVIVVGVGKCARLAVMTLEEILGDRISGGVVIDIEDGTVGRVKRFVGDHPFPTQRNALATRELVRVLQEAGEGDLVLAVISGGGSTLLCLPERSDGIDVETKVVKELFKAGADIVELNTIRKHFSRARGGFLAEHAYPARVVSLIMSDIPGDRIEFVSSGPTIKDTTTVEDAKRIIAKYSIEHRCGFTVAGLIETPKDERYFKQVTNVLIVSNKTALAAMEAEAKRLGWKCTIRDTAFTGEARDVAKRVVDDLGRARPHTVLLYGGESTVTIVRDGKGGRSQELALSAGRFIRETELVLAFASDGKDNTDHGGALCDILTVKRAKTLNEDIDRDLTENASYHFFAAVGDYLDTGNTGSNVSDLIVAMKQ